MNHEVGALITIFATNADVREHIIQAVNALSNGAATVLNGMEQAVKNVSAEAGFDLGALIEGGDTPQDVAQKIKTALHI